ncbi:DNA-binding response regulator MtrA [Azoarcus sp. Aa7]|nr:DNA-binding response regulator MtrA [Azoarcus sp. Aa7]
MKEHVLIVDDHGDIRKLLRLTFNPQHHEIHEAANGAQALALCRQFRPKLVLLDVMMPGDLDGIGVCRKLKADPALAGIRILILSARSQQQDLEAGRAAGADAYLVKPFSPMELIQRVDQFLA